MRICSMQRSNFVSAISSLLLLLLRLRRRELVVVWLVRNAATDLLPRRLGLKVTVGLRELNRLVDDTLLFLVPTQFCVARKREVLAKWVTLKPVVGENAAQVGVTDKENSVHVPSFALEPVRTAEDTCHTRHRRHFIRVRLDADARVVAQTE